METSHRAETFRGLLLRHRGRTGLIQRDLAARSGVSLRSVQDWESGVTLPTAERLLALIRALVEVGGFTPGQERAEARELWMAVQQEAPRMRTPFDEEWFAALLSALAPRTEPVRGTAGAELQPTSAARVQDWGDAPDTAAFVGRATELALVQDWVLAERCRVVAVLGMGGIGKTSLAAMLSQKVASTFERVYWRSLRNAPPVTEWLAGAIAFLSDQQVVPGPNESERITALLQLLRVKRCMLVLDNSETLFEPGQGEGSYRPGMDGYGRILQAIGETAHQSCLVLTSREAPPELAVLNGGVRTLQLQGLGLADAQALLADKQLNCDAETWVSLVNRYGGNGLALKIVSERIRQFYDADVAAFSHDAIATYGTVFGGIRRLLDVQVGRLSPIERDILSHLAVEREPIKLAELYAEMPRTVGRGTVLEAIETLRQRSFVERGDHGATFTLQSMVLEYVTDRLVETIADEIDRGQAARLTELPLIKVQAKDYVRRTQERLIGAPILQRLEASRDQLSVEEQLLSILNAWRGRSAAEQGYGPGNVVNLLRLLRGHLRGLDLSHLSIRNAHFQGVEAQDTNLAGAHLAEAVLAEAFAYPLAVGVSADGTFVAAGTSGGEVLQWRVADRTLLLASHEHSSRVYGAALSGDGRLVASGGADGTLRLWDVPSGQLVATLHGHSGPVLGVVFATDGSFLASCGADGTVKLWEVRSGQLRASLQAHNGPVRSVALTGDGRLLASGGDDSTVKLWELPSRRLLASLEGHTGTVRSVGLAADGTLVASGGMDATARVWDAPSGQLRLTLRGHRGPVASVALAADGGLLSSGSMDGTVRLWEVGSGQPLGTLQGHSGPVRTVALTGDGRLMASGSLDGTVRLWEVPNGELVDTLQGHSERVRSVALSADGQLLASGGDGGTVQLWDVARGRLVAALYEPSGPVWGVALSGDGGLVASGGVDGTLRLWEAPSGKLVRTLHGHTGPVRSMAFAAEGHLLASSSLDTTVQLWETASGQPLATLRGHSGSVWAVALSDDGSLVTTGGADATVRLWEPRSGRLLLILNGHSAPVLDVSLSGSGGLVASGSLDGTVRLWEAPSGRLLATLGRGTKAWSGPWRSQQTGGLWPAVAPTQP